MLIRQPVESDDRAPHPSNPGYEFRVRSAKAMLLAGHPKNEIAAIHGGVVLREAVELSSLQARLRPVKRY
jgi:redox-sensitive bicupin YhaK (pirin superfamily)